MLEKIQTLAKERGISMKELERACELGNGAIAKWENSSPRVDNIKKVADYSFLSQILNAEHFNLRSTVLEFLNTGSLNIINIGLNFVFQRVHRI